MLLKLTLVGSEFQTFIVRSQCFVWCLYIFYLCPRVDKVEQNSNKFISKSTWPKRIQYSIKIYNAHNVCRLAESEARAVRNPRSNLAATSVLGCYFQGGFCPGRGLMTATRFGAMSRREWQSRVGLHRAICLFTSFRRTAFPRRKKRYEKAPTSLVTRAQDFTVPLCYAFTCRWLGGVMVRASDLWLTGREFDSRPYTAGLVLRWVTVCGRVNHLSMQPIT